MTTSKQPRCLCGNYTPARPERCTRCGAPLCTSCAEKARATGGAGPRCCSSSKPTT